MEVNNVSGDGDEYIDMEISSSPLDELGSPMKQCRGFEFAVTSTAQDGLETKEFPADELFYKGKLLPLHLPPRLQMVERLRSPKTRRSYHGQDGDEFQEDDMLLLPTVLVMPSVAPRMGTSTWLIRNILPSGPAGSVVRSTMWKTTTSSRPMSSGISFTLKRSSS
ncbi:hypothetical protein SAY87_028001 [Trapa incisa]|uniref:Uncharacterized protein n=1 Tax=Trapa incisa TaxID=236973 RepID=A0AAN7QNF5_9MYRT|nr:hypothetical protein SAY87_028001 [Trapa incisa]